MAKLSTQTGMSKFETLLIERNVISGTFLELTNNEFSNTFNFKRLSLLAFTTAMFIRFLIILIFNDPTVFIMFGDVLWRLGVTGYFLISCNFMMILIMAWYLIVIAYCEHHGYLGFLNDLSIATQIKSDYSVAINTKALLLYKVLMVNAYLIPYVNGAIVLALCNRNAYQFDNSISQLLYNLIWSVFFLICGNKYVVIIFVVSIIVYLSASLINNQLSILYIYLKHCKDPFTLNRVLDEYNDIMVKIHQSNKFVKFVLGTVNFLAIIVVSNFLSVLSLPHHDLVMMCLIFTAESIAVLVFVITAAFLASVHNKVRCSRCNIHDLHSIHFI